MTTHPPAADLALNALIAEACQYPIGTVQRQRLLTQIISQIQKSGKIWKGGAIGDEHAIDDYHEALQQTWLYLCRNLNAYDPSQASVTTWLNHYLKYRLLNIRQQRQQERLRSQPPSPPSTHCSEQDWIDPIDRIPSPPPPSTLLEDLTQWIHANATTLQSKHVQHRRDINCYILILHRLPPETAWHELAQSLNTSISTLSNFYRRECLPRLRQFLESQL